MTISIPYLFEQFYSCLTPDMHPLFMKRQGAEAREHFWRERFLEAIGEQEVDKSLSAWTEVPQIWLRAWNKQQEQIDQLEKALAESKDKLHKMKRNIDEVSQALIDRADQKATSDPHMYETKRAYFQGMAEGLNTFRHSMGLSDEND